MISAAASASPELPVKSPAQLLAAVAARTGPPPPLTGTVVETASLGIPQLPGPGNQNSAVSLLAGSQRCGSGTRTRPTSGWRCR